MRLFNHWGGSNIENKLFLPAFALNKGRKITLCPIVFYNRQQSKSQDLMTSERQVQMIKLFTSSLSYTDNTYSYLEIPLQESGRNENSNGFYVFYSQVEIG